MTTSAITANKQCQGCEHCMNNDPWKCDILGLVSDKELKTCKLAGYKVWKKATPILVSYISFGEL
jgi:flavoprotein